MKRLKIYLVRRWLHLLDPEELIQRGQDERIRTSLDKAYATLNRRMLDAFYEGHND